MKNTGVVAGACLACCLVAPAPGSSAAGTPIYKCFDRNLGLLYTDEPCKEGEQMDIRPGEADPAAVARLERLRDALDQSASERIADMRRVPAEGKVASRSHYLLRDEGGPYDYGPAYVSDYGIVAHRFVHHRGMGLRSQLRIRHFASPPPYFVPRR